MQRADGPTLLSTLSLITISLLITCILAEGIDFEIGHFRSLRTSVTLTGTYSAFSFGIFTARE